MDRLADLEDHVVWNSSQSNNSKRALDHLVSMANQPVTSFPPHLAHSKLKTSRSVSEPFNQTSFSTVTSFSTSQPSPPSSVSSSTVAPRTTRRYESSARRSSRTSRRSDSGLPKSRPSRDELEEFQRAVMGVARSVSTSSSAPSNAFILATRRAEVAPSDHVSLQSEPFTSHTESPPSPRPSSKTFRAPSNIAEYHPSTATPSAHFATRSAPPARPQHTTKGEGSAAQPNIIPDETPLMTIDSPELIYASDSMRSEATSSRAGAKRVHTRAASTPSISGSSAAANSSTRHQPYTKSKSFGTTTTGQSRMRPPSAAPIKSPFSTEHQPLNAPNAPPVTTALAHSGNRPAKPPSSAGLKPLGMRGGMPTFSPKPFRVPVAKAIVPPPRARASVPISNDDVVIGNEDVSMSSDISLGDTSLDAVELVEVLKRYD